MSPSHYLDFSLHAELFRFILAGKSGSVAVNPGGRRLFFENGQLVYALSDERDELFTHFLVERGLVMDDQLEALKRELGKGESLAGVLKQRGLVSAQDLAHALKLQIIRITDRVFALAQCHAEFAEKALPPKMPRLKIQTLNLFAKAVTKLQVRYLPIRDEAFWQVSESYPGPGFAETPEILLPWIDFLESRSFWAPDDAGYELQLPEEKLRLCIYLLQQMGWIEAAAQVESDDELDETHSEQRFVPIEVEWPKIEPEPEQVIEDQGEELETAPAEASLAGAQANSEAEEPREERPASAEAEAGVGADVLEPAAEDEEILSLEEDTDSTQPGIQPQPIVVEAAGAPDWEHEEVQVLEPGPDDTNPAFEPLSVETSEAQPLAEVSKSQTTNDEEEYEIDDDAGPEDFTSVTKDLEEQADELDFEMGSREEGVLEPEPLAEDKESAPDAAFDALDRALAEFRPESPKSTLHDPFGFASDDEPEPASPGGIGAEMAGASKSASAPELAPGERKGFVPPPMSSGPLHAVFSSLESTEKGEPLRSGQGEEAPIERKADALDDEDEPEELEKTQKKRRRPLLVAVLFLLVLLPALYVVFNKSFEDNLDGQEAVGSQKVVEMLPETMIQEDRAHEVQELGVDSAGQAGQVGQVGQVGQDAQVAQGDSPAPPLAVNGEAAGAASEAPAASSAKPAQEVAAPGVAAGDRGAQAAWFEETSSLPEPLGSRMRELLSGSQARFGDGKGRYSIAFITACKAYTLKEQLARVEAFQLLVLPRELNGSSCYVFAWGQFRNKQEAVSAIVDLPAGLLGEGDRAMAIDSADYFR